MTKRYFALCPTCGNERELSRSVVATGRIPVCDGNDCATSMDVYTRDPRPRRRAPEDIAREVC